VGLAAWRDGDELVLRVADTGRVTSELRRALTGRAPGLGLRIVLSLLAEDGGRLELRADEPGVVLEVRLPGPGPGHDR
jgi:signal transduction histidine kinase